MRVSFLGGAAAAVRKAPGTRGGRKAAFRTLRDGVYYDAMQSSIKHRSSDSKRLDGLNPHMAIFDEIHEYRDFKLINIIKRKIVKRLQPNCLLMNIGCTEGISGTDVVFFENGAGQELTPGFPAACKRRCLESAIQ